MQARSRTLLSLASFSLLIGCSEKPTGPDEPQGSEPATLEVASGNGQTVVPSTPITPSVVVLDDEGKPVPGIKVGFTVEAGGGSVDTDSVETGADGTASVTWKLGPLPAANHLRAGVAELAPVQITATGAYDVPVTVVAGTLTLPAGAGLGLAALRVETAIADVPVTGSGGFSIATIAGGGEHLATAHAGGDAVLMGWIDADRRVLNARTTAELLTYMDIAAYTLPSPEQRDSVRFELGRRDLGVLTTAIETMLKGDAASMALNTPAILNARRATVEALEREFSMPRGIIIEPAGVELSGTVVDQVGLNNITITNHRRRRVAAFVDRVSFVPKGLSAPQPAATAGEPIYLNAVGAATSIITTAIDVLFGNWAWVPVVSPAQPVPLAPGNAVSTRYRVTVVGSGIRNPAITLTPVQRAAQERVAKETFVLEFLLPLIEQAFAADNGLKKWGGGPKADVESKLSEIYEMIPASAIEQLLKGDMMGALVSTWKTIQDSGKAQDLFFNTFFTMVAKQGMPEAVIKEKAKKWVKAFAIVEGVAATLDLIGVVVHNASSNDAESWDVTVGEAEVRLNPPTSTIPHGELVVLQASVLEVTGGGPAPVFHYRWSTTGQHGTICAQFAGCATSIPSSSRDRVSYSPDLNTEGTDEVHVVVFVVEGGQEHIIGEAKATVTTFKPTFTLSPMQSTIDYNERVDFSATIDPRLQDVGIVTYHWSTAGALGQFTTGGTTIDGSSSTATYAATAQVEGTEQVTVIARATKDGATRTIGTATATIVVEHEPPDSIVGRFEVSEPIGLDAGRQCVTAYIAFPLVPEARGYAVRAFNFNDATFGSEITFDLTPPLPAYVPCSLAGWGSSGSTGSEYRYLLSGLAGPPSAVADAISSFNARFAGMVVDVTVQY